MQEVSRTTPDLPQIPSKRYFSIGEVSKLCDVKPHVLRYWEQEFPQLKPLKRRGNRRYYQRHDILLVREIRHLLYQQGFTIQGARQRLANETAGKTADPAEKHQRLARELLAELEEVRALLGPGTPSMASSNT